MELNEEETILIIRRLHKVGEKEMRFLACLCTYVGFFSFRF